MTQQAQNPGRSNLGKFLSHLRFEFISTLKGPLPWIALGVLVLLLLAVKGIFVADFSINAQEVTPENRLAFTFAAAYSGIAFITSLYLLGLALDKFGSGYLNGHDLVILSRAVPRKNFLGAKIISVLLNGAVYLLLCITALWLVLYMYSGINLYSLFWVFPLQLLNISAIAAMYLFLRTFLPNFPAFFVILILLPVIYFQNLFQLYRFDGVSNSIFFEYLLPPLGDIHAMAWGLVQEFFKKDQGGQPVAKVAVWMVVYLSATMVFFRRKRL